MIIAELVDQCNLKCALCPTRFRKQSGRQMSLSIVKKILERYPNRWIYWYSWGEPLLHKEFVKIADLVEGHLSRISTNLSMKLDDDRIKAMRKFSVVVVSISGMTQDIYEINHKGGNLDLVMDNLNRLLSFRNNPRDTVINWLEHKYNMEQRPQIEELCKKNRLIFNPCFMVCTIEELNDGFDSELLVDPKFQKTDRTMCRIIDWTPIDVDGNYVLCCASQNVPIGYNIDNNVSPQQLLQARLKTPLCTICKEKELWRMFS